jgi:hypothetical protein
MATDVKLTRDSDITEVLLMTFSATEDKESSLGNKQTHLIQAGRVELGKLKTGDSSSHQRCVLIVSTSAIPRKLLSRTHLFQDDARLMEDRQGWICSEGHIIKVL